MRKRILYNVSNIVIEKLVEENASFKVLLRAYFEEEKENILKGKFTSIEEELMFEEVTQYLSALV